MRVSISKRFRKFLLSCLIAGIPAFSVSNSFASERAADHTIKQLPIHQTMEGFDIWCGQWVDVGTHDSIPSASGKAFSQEKRESLPAPVAASEHPSLMPALALLAESVSRKAGISIQQLIEPFAMVTPYAQSTLEDISRLQAIAQSIGDSDSTHEASDDAASSELLVDDESSASTNSESNADEPSDAQYEGTLPVPTDLYVNHCLESFPATDDLISELDTLALEEPIDAFVSGPTPSHPALTNPPKSDASIGSSSVAESPVAESQVKETQTTETSKPATAIIATIEEEYLPYDLASRDIHVWNFFPMVYKPYCILNRNNHVEKLDLWNERQPDVSEVASQPVYLASADCLLDELIWKLDEATPAIRRTFRRTNARRVGREMGKKLASVVISGHQVASDAFTQIVSTWPASPVKPEAVNAGAALLVRAEAVEASEAKEQIADQSQEIAR